MSILYNNMFLQLYGACWVANRRLDRDCVGHRGPEPQGLGRGCQGSEAP